MNDQLLRHLDYLGLIPTETRSANAGTSNYSQHLIQPWSIWLDYPELTHWDMDIVKRVLRTKQGDPRSLDYKKIIHICEERLRQLEFSEGSFFEDEGVCNSIEEPTTERRYSYIRHHERYSETSAYYTDEEAKDICKTGWVKQEDKFIDVDLTQCCK